MDHISQAESTFSTWDLLHSLGFSGDVTVISDTKPGLSFDFGNFKLEAGRGATLSGAPIVFFGGVIATARTLGEVDFQIPLELESREVCLAFLAYYLDNTTSDTFKPKIEPHWLSEGRKYQHLLPWERKKIAYEARPHCYVDRDWARVAFKKLAEQLANVNDESLVTFSLDGAVLTIVCGASVYAMSAVGKSWTKSYSIRARALKELPKRLMTNMVEVSVWDSRLVLGNRRYTGISDISDSEKLNSVIGAKN